MEGIIIIGGKGTAINVAQQIADAGQRFGLAVEVLGFAIDDPALGRSIAGFPVLCKTREAVRQFTSPEVKFVFALYRPDRMQERVDLLHSLEIPAARFATFIHPLAYVSPTAAVGKGTVVFAHASIHHNAVIGDFSLLNSSAAVNHDSQVGRCCFIAAAACVGSEATVGEGTFIGLHATIREHVHVGKYAFIGMGSVVIRDVADRSLVYGVPAEPRGC